MIKGNTIEATMGFIVLVTALGFIIFAINFINIGLTQGYIVYAFFNDVGGLRSGSDVRMNGVKIGSITDVSLAEQTYMARLSISVDEDVNLPLDSEAMIASDGLSGSKYLIIKAGSATEYLSAEGIIERTNDFQSIEEQVSRIVFLAGGAN